MYSFTYPNNPAPWQAYSSYVKSVIIGEGVTSIGDYAFYDMQTLKKVSFSDTVLSIGENAFYYTSLENVTIGNSVESIGYCAFSWCQSLVTVVIPDSVITIGNNSFSNCSNLKKVYFGDSVKTIDDCAFFECYSLENVDIPNSVETIGNSAFEGCFAFTEIVIPDSVTTVGSCAFLACKSVTELTIGNSLKAIDYSVFSSCLSLTSIVIPDSVESIGNSAFENCTALTSVTIPESVTTIYQNAFHNRSGLPLDITVICYENSYAHTYAADNGFKYELISTDPYSGKCGDNLTWIYDPNTGILAIRGTGDMYDYTDSYGGPWCQYPIKTVIFEDGVRSIGNGAFIESSVQNIIFNSVKTIGNSAFYWCFGLKSVTIGDHVETIGGSAFDTCMNLAEITLPDSLTTIGSGAFDNCSSLKSILIPESVTSIGEFAFTYRHTKILCYMHSYAYEYALRNDDWYYYDIVVRKTESGPCGADVTWTLDTETGVFEISGTGNMYDYWDHDGFVLQYETNVPWYPIRGYIKSVVINEGVTSVGDYSFYGAWGIESITVPMSVTKIGSNAIDSFSGIMYCYNDSYAHKYALSRGFAYELMCDHSFTNYISDNNAACTEDGTKTAVCDNGCGAVDTITDVGSRTGHDWSEWFTTVEPTVNSEGVKMRFCNLCLETVEAAIPALENLNRPVITVDNFTVTITNAEDIKDMRYAPGMHTTTTEIRNAEGNVALDNSIVVKHTVDGNFVYTMPNGGYYSLWIRMKDGTNHIMSLDLTVINASVSTYGVKVTVHDIYDVKDIYIAKGEFETYREIKDNGYIVALSTSKIGNKRDYTYTVYEPGVHTVLIRYNDGRTALFHEELTVDEPVFTTNGLQVTISNIPDVKVIRTAYGEYNTPGDTKRAAGARNFSNKAVIKNAEEYTLQYREDGIVTIIVEYNNGYIKVFNYEVKSKHATMIQSKTAIMFKDLDDFVMIRYAEGKFATSSEIKRAKGSKVIKPTDLTGAYAMITGLKAGTYTFCVQFDDESYDYYTVTVQ